jgi:hypothetical protein
VSEFEEDAGVVSSGIFRYEIAIPAKAGID